MNWLFLGECLLAFLLGFFSYVVIPEFLKLGAGPKYFCLSPQCLATRREEATFICVHHVPGFGLAYCTYLNKLIMGCCCVRWTREERHFFILSNLVLVYPWISEPRKQLAETCDVCFFLLPHLPSFICWASFSLFAKINMSILSEYCEEVRWFCVCMCPL